MVDQYTRLMECISPLRNSLVNHPVYTQLCDLESLRIFMESHCFAVWDFMCLVKTLQARLTCVTTPWLPPSDIFSARLINDIVLAEETDEVAPGYFISHFDLYVAGMKEVSANVIPIQNFIHQLREGKSVQVALNNVATLTTTKAFVLNTIKATHKTTHEVAATFLLGREDVIPSMFRRILQSLEDSSIDCQQLSLYLERHTHLDEDVHGPMGEQLLRNLCGDDDEKWKQSTFAAQQALLARISLWDGLVLQLRNGRRSTPTLERKPMAFVPSLSGMKNWWQGTNEQVSINIPDSVHTWS
jgi:hypothetical protein